jgi:hypothetical protein
MNIRIWLFALLILPAFFSRTSAAQSAEKPVFVQENTVSSEEMEEKKKRALDGSQEMALDLMWLTFDNDDQEVPIFWAQIEMENGSLAGRHGYATLLFKKGDYISLARAAYHLRALSDQGDGDASVLLKEVEKKRQRLKP